MHGRVLRSRGLRSAFESQPHALQDPQAEYEQLPREHELLSVVSQIVEAAERREDAAKMLASKVFTQMFEVTNSR